MVKYTPGSRRLSDQYSVYVCREVSPARSIRSIGLIALGCDGKPSGHEGFSAHLTKILRQMKILRDHLPNQRDACPLVENVCRLVSLPLSRPTQGPSRTAKESPLHEPTTSPGNVTSRDAATGAENGSRAMSFSLDTTAGRQPREQSNVAPQEPWAQHANHASRAMSHPKQSPFRSDSPAQPESWWPMET